VTFSDPIRQKARSESILLKGEYDFSAKYLALCELHDLCRSDTGIIDAHTTTALETVLKDDTIARQTQAFFFFKETADILCTIGRICLGTAMADHAFEVLRHALTHATGQTHRAVTAALGSLPLSVRGDGPAAEPLGALSRVDFQQVVAHRGLAPIHAPRFRGRSLIAKLEEPGKILVIKLARSNDTALSLESEALWMDHVAERCQVLPVRFDIPRPVRVAGGHVFRIRDFPVDPPHGIRLHPKHYAIGFTAHEQYFSYLNKPGTGGVCSDGEFQDILFRNARLLGSLTSLGLVHSAPIPLFHNRIQMHRRGDQGVYEWTRAGRLDQWLSSCDFPNLGPTGVRDFEHFVAVDGQNRPLYPHIGTHLLSLLLITGSYFRNKDRNRMGWDGEGRPVDVRELFQPKRLGQFIEGIFLNYYEGFVGTSPKMNLPFDLSRLTFRMIEEMGVDRHMAEILRVQDQIEMSHDAFCRFLREKGFSGPEMEGLRKGDRDITILSGPHLGGFNEGTSLPELTEAVGAMSALCIAGRYCEENLKGSGHGNPLA
jgi:hypothetical protein